MDLAIDALLTISIFGLATIAIVLLLQPFFMSLAHDSWMGDFFIPRAVVQDRRGKDRRKKVVSCDGVYIRAYEFEHVSIPVELCEREGERRIGDRRK